MTTMTTIPDAAAEALAPATLHAHHDPDAAEAVAQRAADVVASIAALRSAAAARGTRPRFHRRCSIWTPPWGISPRRMLIVG